MSRVLEVEVSAVNETDGECVALRPGDGLKHDGKLWSVYVREPDQGLTVSGDSFARCVADCCFRQDALDVGRALAAYHAVRVVDFTHGLAA